MGTQLFSQQGSDRDKQQIKENAVEHLGYNNHFPGIISASYFNKMEKLQEIINPEACPKEATVHFFFFYLQKFNIKSSREVIK